MFNMMSLLLWIMLATNFGDSSLKQRETEQNRVIMDIESQIANHQDSILSENYVVAKKALDKAITERDEATIRLGLNKGSLSLRKDVIQAVRDAYFQSLVPDLITALEEIKVSGKTATEQQIELKRTIVSALMHLTGLRFPNTELLSQNDVQKIVEESREWYRASEVEIQQKVVSEMLEGQQEVPILSKNYRTAKGALDKAVLEQDKSIIRLALERDSLSFRTKVVQTIKQFNDKSFVPDLINALERNQTLMSGGSETEFEQQDLNKEIISALKQLTGLDFPYLRNSSTMPCFKDCPSKDIERVLKESREWYKLHKKEN